MDSLRQATAGDYEAFVQLFPELRVDDPIPSRESWTANLMPGTTVVERDGRVVGYSYCQLLAESAYVRNVVVAPWARRSGVGRALMERIRDEARSRGLQLWELNVMPDNLPAIRLYRSFGLTERYRSLSLRLPWSLLDRLPPAATGTSGRLLDPPRDALIERTFGLPAGLVAVARTSDRHVLLELVDEPSGTPRGYARFSPHFPGAFPFRLADPSLARLLLEQMRRYALPELDYTEVVVEDDDPLARLLVDAGAELRHEVLHYVGSL
jgi:GNAT superfamily N-acetyltransferase